MLKRGYRKLIKYLDKLSLNVRLIKQFIGEHLEINKMNNNAPVKGYKLTKAQIKEIKDYWKNLYGKKIQTKWHLKYYGYSGKYDVDFFPEILYTTKLEPKLNPEMAVKVLADKSLIELLYAKVLEQNSDIVVPATLCGASNGYYYDADRNSISFEKMRNLCNNANGEFIIKPSIGESSGYGVKLLKLHNGIDECSGKAIPDIIREYGENFIIQHKVRQNSKFAQLHPESVNTIRIMTYRVDGEIKVTPAIMRIGIGDTHLDNAHAGGVYIGVSDEGILQNRALRNYSDFYYVHPDTNIKFAGYQLPEFQKIIDAAKKLHACLPMIGVANWDLTMNEENQVVLIETNLGCGSIWLFQNTWGKGVFGTDTKYMVDLIRK